MSNNDYEIKFWKDWLDADLIKRQELVEGLPLFKMCLKMKDDEIWKRSFATLINGFFEDLESAVHTQNRIKNPNRNHEQQSIWPKMELKN
jgi:hypothetical protein